MVTWMPAKLQRYQVIEFKFLRTRPVNPGHLHEVVFDTIGIRHRRSDGLCPAFDANGLVYVLLGHVWVCGLPMCNPKAENGHGDVEGMKSVHGKVDKRVVGLEYW